VINTLLTLIVAALGSMVSTSILTKVLEGLGIRRALGILAICSVVLLSIASAPALSPQKFETRCTRIVGWKTFLDPLFVSLAVVNFIHPLTMAILMVFGPQFAGSVGASVTQGSYLLAINSEVGVPGRLCTGWLADNIGHLNVLVVATAMYDSATWVLWLSATMTSNVGLYIAMSVFHGLSDGVFRKAQVMTFNVNSAMCKLLWRHFC
jgi:cyanate permease